MTWLYKRDLKILEVNREGKILNMLNVMYQDEAVQVIKKSCNEYWACYYLPTQWYSLQVQAALHLQLGSPKCFSACLVYVTDTSCLRYFLYALHLRLPLGKLNTEYDGL